MKEKIKKYLKEASFFILSLFIISNIFSYYRSQDLNKDNLDLKSVKLLNNKSYELPKNKPILLHFWATWCPTCKFEAPNIQKISKDYEVITIAVQSGKRQEIQSYLDKHNYNFKVVNDTDGFFSNKFNIKVFPTTFIYDSNRQLKFSEVGYTSTAGLYSRMALSK